PEQKVILADLFKTKTRSEWNDVFANVDCCYAPVNSVDEAINHPHMQARQSFIAIDDIMQPAPTPKFSRTPGEVRHAPPKSGADTESVLKSFGIKR
ncbi:MAG: CoA transferase, partial [Coxiellaceae bacterium]|nr:CoA transferase [Coxiellaceae bacterium]